MSTAYSNSKHSKLKALMHTYFDVAQEALFSLDHDFHLHSINEFAQQRLHFNIKHLIGQPFFHLTRNPDEKFLLEQRLQEFAKSDRLHLQFTMTWQTPAGEVFEMAIQISKFKDIYIGSAKDLSDTLLALSKLYESQSNFETVIEHNLTGILITDLQGVVLFANSAAAKLMHLECDHLIGYSFGNLQPMHAGEKFEIDFLRPNLPPGRAEISSARTTWREQPANLVMIHDITDLYEARKHIEQLAYFDPLTKLPNRAFFLTMLDKTIARYQRHQAGFAVLYMDLDDFKSINDNFGHADGDLLLAQVAERLRTSLRNEDLLSRMGGDEFTAIIENISTPNDVKNLALKIQQKFKQPMKLGTQEIYTNISIGIALYPEHSEDSSTLLSQADIAMYAAKNQHHTHYAFFSPEMRINSQQDLQQKNRLHSALINHEFRLFYQPQMNLKTHEIESYEGLLRWQKSATELVCPDAFIPILEQTGLIIEVGEWILDTAITQLETWQSHNKPLKKISINVSPVQLFEENFVSVFLKRIQRSSIEPKWLALEITESTFISNMIHSQQTILELQHAGIEVHMDDFGSGYSSFNELKNLPFDVIKIDQAFIKQIDSDPRDVILVEAMIRALHGLEKKVIAEGIENNTQKHLLEQLGCDIIQGYLLSQPKPIEELERD